MLPFITLDGLSARAPDGRVLFDNLTLALAGERTGLVGANGFGKTTLVRLILGELTPAAGAVTRRGRFGVLRQSLAPPPGATVADLLDISDDLVRLQRIERGEGTDKDFDLARWDLTADIDVALPPSGLAVGRLVLAFEDVAFAFPGAPPLMPRLNLRLTGPERVAVTGPNRVGKTTLIRLAVGDLQPMEGRVLRGVTAVMLDQRAALLRDDESLIENYRRLNPGAGDHAAHVALARFLFRNVAALRPAGALSGGERLRAALACVLMAAYPPQLIILDEPTNHLDLDSIAAVEQALAAYDGALLIVSHDEEFLASVGVERRLELQAGRGLD